MTVHELKTWPKYFEPVCSGLKRFELRRNDRNYQVGDQLLLKEWKPTITYDDGKGGQTVCSHYTGREALVEVDYIMKSQDADFVALGYENKSPIAEEYVIMSIRLIH